MSDEMPPPNDKGEAKKRVVRRKPLWLVVPVEYGDIVSDDGEITRTPTRYELYECVNKKEILTVIGKLGLDTTNLNPDHIKIFRADPVPLKLSTQVTIKF